MIETFLDIKGFEGYRVSNFGTVQSWWKRGNHKQKIGNWHTIFGRQHEKGYTVVTLLKDRVEFRFLVHVLVLETFVSPRPLGMVARHLDGDTSNNRSDNLVWGTQEENCQDTIKHGRTTRGKSHKLQLNEDAVRSIRELYKEGYNCAQISRKLWVNISTVHNVVTGSCWSWVK
jgi:hypothetical protein